VSVGVRNAITTGYTGERDSKHYFPIIINKYPDITE
jgi:hypothetical protein